MTEEEKEALRQEFFEMDIENQEKIQQLLIQHEMRGGVLGKTRKEAIERERAKLYP